MTLVASFPSSCERIQQPFPFSTTAWDKTLPAVHAYLLSLYQRLDQLQQQIDQLQGRLDKTSQTSSKPPSSDSPCTKRPRHTSSGTRGGKTDHPRTDPKRLEPTDVHVILLLSCPGGQAAFLETTLYYIHQVFALPPLEMQVTHCILHQATCVGCGQTHEAQASNPYATGYGSRLTALKGHPNRKAMKTATEKVQYAGKLSTDN